MFNWNFHRSKSAVEEMKQVVAQVKHAVEEVKPVFQEVQRAVQEERPVIQGGPPAVKPVVQAAKFMIPEGATLEQIVKEMMGLMAAADTNHHRMGQLYNHVVDHQLAQKAGFKDAPTYFRQRLVNVSPSALNMYGSVAKSFSEEVAARYGVTCLYLLLTYKEAAAVKVNHDEPGGTLIEVPGKDGQVTARPFSACSVDDLRKALQLKRKPASSKPVPAEDVELASLCRAALEGQFPTGSHVKVVVRNEKGSSVLDFTGVPTSHLGTLILALMERVPMEGKPRGPREQ